MHEEGNLNHTLVPVNGGALPPSQHSADLQLEPAAALAQYAAPAFNPPSSQAIPQHKGLSHGQYALLQPHHGPPQISTNDLPPLSEFPRDSAYESSTYPLVTRNAHPPQEYSPSEVHKVRRDVREVRPAPHSAQLERGSVPGVPLPAHCAPFCPRVRLDWHLHVAL